MIMLIRQNMAFVQKSAFLFLSLLIFLNNCVQCPNEDELQASVTVQEQRAFIKISVLLNKAATGIDKELENALSNRAYFFETGSGIGTRISNQTKIIL